LYAVVGYTVGNDVIRQQWQQAAITSLLPGYAMNFDGFAPSD
jgi:2-keto-4-pentenoate hydratase/2-oxohepta-3-ene-1,7-dioic acid hydratase in catechol pathway